MILLIANDWFLQTFQNRLLPLRKKRISWNCSLNYGEIQNLIKKDYLEYLRINKMSSQQATTTLTQPAPKMTLKEKRMAREIKRYQQYAGTFLPAATFRRLVSSVTEEQCGQGIRFNSQSIKALQMAAEDEITTTFQGANIIASVAGRDTVTPDDIKTFNVLREM